MDRRIDLDRARRDAKALLRAARAGDRDALGRLRPDRAPRLADAQHTVAQELGAPSWPALVERVESRAVDELLELASAGRRNAALVFARERPRVCERLRGWSAGALIDAARAGRAGTVYTLLELGVPPNTRDPETGGTALHVAARAGWIDVVDVLVGWVPVDRHAVDAAGATALEACVDGSPGDDGRHLVIAKILVANGLRPDARLVERASGRLRAWLRDRLAEPAAGQPPLDDSFGELSCAAEAALLGYLAGSPLAEVRRLGDGFAVRTGLFDNTCNGVVCSRLPVASADDRIAEAHGWLRGLPAQWLVAAETEPADLRERLERAGCRPERSAVYMAASLEGRDLGDRPAGIEIAGIADARELTRVHLAVAGPSDDPHERELALLASLGLDADRPLRHYAASLGGRPVGIASVFVVPPTLDLVELEVAAPDRRRGIGRALVLHALREGRAAGCTVAVLDPTPATIPFYETLGFRLGRAPADRSFYMPLE